ncbi:hypothetical protein MRS44_017047 [Fusarium solani]|uniref:uncharacterized protein n=1 Tax=Fusarium solani TaxID=169388 RepID=UPI0032C41E33|nr:hypothetical protein MRS44_017047 [Fusarium solani]
MLSGPKSVGAQVEEFNIEDPRHLTLESLLRIRIGRQTFVLHTWVYRRNKLRSFIINHGWGLIEVTGSNTLGDPFWVCKLCDRQGKGKSSLCKLKATSSARHHLQIQHSITQAGTPETSSSAASLALAALQSHARPPPPTTKAAVEQFKEALIHWIVEPNIPLNTVKHDTFQRLLRTPSDIINAAFPRHHETIKQWVMDDFRSGQKLIQRQLQESKSAIRISFDTWTSPSQQALLGIVSHFIDSAGNPKDKLLALRRISGPHSGANIAPLVAEVINNFDIQISAFSPLTTLPSTIYAFRISFSINLTSFRACRRSQTFQQSGYAVEATSSTLLPKPSLNPQSSHN